MRSHSSHRRFGKARIDAKSSGIPRKTESEDEVRFCSVRSPIEDEFLASSVTAERITGAFRYSSRSSSAMSLQLGGILPETTNSKSETARPLSLTSIAIPGLRWAESPFQRPNR